MCERSIAEKNTWFAVVWSFLFYMLTFYKRLAVIICSCMTTLFSSQPRYDHRLMIRCGPNFYHARISDWFSNFVIFLTSHVDSLHQLLPQLWLRPYILLPRMVAHQVPEEWHCWIFKSYSSMDMFVLWALIPWLTWGLMTLNRQQTLKPKSVFPPVCLVKVWLQPLWHTESFPRMAHLTQGQHITLEVIANICRWDNVQNGETKDKVTDRHRVTSDAHFLKRQCNVSSSSTFTVFLWRIKIKKGLFLWP